MSKYSTRYFSNKQEKAVAKAVNGRQVTSSGAGLWQKGDVNTDLFLIECKTVTKPREQFTLRKEWFDKNEEERFQMGKLYSALVFQFEPNGENHYVISERLFQELQKCLREENEK